MSRDDVTIRRARPGDDGLVRGLLAEHLGPHVDVDARYRWLYRENPHGFAVTWIAFDARSGEPAGMTSLFPRRVSVHGTVRLGSIGGDGYVRERFRRRGIATALHRASLEQMGEVGVELMYGPPEPNNLRALVRAGSRVVCQLRRFVRPLGLGRLGQRLARFAEPVARLLAPPRSPLRLEPIVNEDARVRRIWEQAMDDLPIAPVRDPAFYAWRFARTPSQRKLQYLVLDGPQAVAACALDRDGRRTQVLDVLAPRIDWERTIDAILDACRDDDAVEIRLNERGPLSASLLRHGFLPRDRHAFQVLVEDGHPQASALRRAGSWYYTSGDGDVAGALGS
jgi:GNAT superfamily N-acetyltransferase